MKKKKKRLIIGIFLLLGIVVLGGIYLLNNQNKLMNLSMNDNTEELADLTFDNRAYIKDIINTSNITNTFTEEQTKVKEEYAERLNTLYNALADKVGEKKEELLAKEAITTSDIDDFRSFLIDKAEDYNTALAELSGEANQDLYTTIVYNMPLLDYYYIDGIEGTYLIDVNYAYLYNVFKDKLTGVGKDYCILKDKIYKYSNSNYLYKDGSLVISWSELEEVLLLYDAYMKEYPIDTLGKNEYDELFKVYINETALPGTPIYGQDGKTINEDVLNTYLDIINNHSDFAGYDQVKTMYENYQESHVVSCSVNLKYADYVDIYNTLDVDINSDNNIMKALLSTFNGSNNCNQATVTLTDIKVGLTVRYYKADTSDIYSTDSFMLEKITYGKNNLEIENSIEGLSLKNINGVIVINVIGSVPIGEAVVIKNNTFYYLKDIDYVRYENNKFSYDKYNYDYTMLLVSACTENEIKETDRSKMFMEQGTVTFNGDKYTLNKTKTVTVNEQCGIIDEYINEN